MLSLPALALLALGLVLSWQRGGVTEDDFVGGDGGAMVLLQTSAARQWNGIGSPTEENGEDPNSDFGFVCESAGHQEVKLVRRYGRDMLILADSEWGAYGFQLPSGETVVVQQFRGGDNPSVLVTRALEKRPTKSFPFRMQDGALYLRVAADPSNKSLYGYKKLPVTPGRKRCDL
jgi:hypothetical protein